MWPSAPLSVALGRYPGGLQAGPFAFSTCPHFTLQVPCRVTTLYSVQTQLVDLVLLNDAINAKCLTLGHGLTL